MKINSIPQTADAIRLRAFPVDALKTIGVAGTIANNATDANNDIDFTDISCFGSLGGSISVPGTVTKRLDASWVAGTGNGGLFSGNKATSTTYHCHAIIKDSDGSEDYGFDTSLTAANRPSGYTEYRRVASILTDSSGNIRAFKQIGDSFIWASGIVEITTSSPPTSDTLQTVTTPSGIRVETVMRLRATATVAGNQFTVGAGDSISLADNIITAQVNGIHARMHARTFTDTASRVRMVASTASNWTSLSITSSYYIDDRRD